MTDNPPEATPLWYQRMVRQFEDERQAHLYTRQILIDLIAELRSYADDGYIMGAATMREVCAYAEARLREVGGE